MHRTLTCAALLLTVGLPLYAAAQTADDWKALTHYDKAAAKKQLTQRLTKYVTFDTQSQPSTQVPSTPGQMKFAKELAKELKKNGAVNVKVDASSIVTAEIPANLSKPTPVIAFLAHMDTALEVPGKNVKPQVHNNYQGDSLVISKEQNLVLNAYNAPQLLRAKGHDIITASGGTLLGADNKAGIAIMMTLAQYLYDYPAIKHGTIKLVFLPDGQTGTGISRLHVPALAADYAYTLGGSDRGEITVETFNAKAFTASWEGYRTVDPGQAAHSPFADNVLMASDFHTLLPRYKRPETTAERRGFILVNDITTRGNRSEIHGILRAFSEEEMQALVQDVTQAFNTVKTINPKGKNFSLTFADQGKNMKDTLPEKVVQLAELAMQAEDVTPKRWAARGETDGARLALMGLPAPDLFSGQYNARSELEYADVDVMEDSLRAALRLVSLGALQPALSAER